MLSEAYGPIRVAGRAYGGAALVSEEENGLKERAEFTQRMDKADFLPKSEQHVPLGIAVKIL